MNKAIEYAEQRSKSFRDVVQELELQGYTVRPIPLTEKQLAKIEEEEESKLVHGFLREYDSRNSISGFGGSITFYKYTRTFDIIRKADNQLVGYMNIGFDNSPATVKHGLTWKEAIEEQGGYGYRNSKYSISGYEGDRLREKGLPTKEITGAKFRFYQGYLWNPDSVDLDYYLKFQEYRERPFKEIYRPGAKDTQRRFGHFYSLAEIKNRLQTVKEGV